MRRPRQGVRCRSSLSGHLSRRVPSLPACQRAGRSAASLGVGDVSGERDAGDGGIVVGRGHHRTVSRAMAARLASRVFEGYYCGIDTVCSGPFRPNIVHGFANA